LKDPPARVGLEKFELDGFTIIINAWTKAHGFQDTKLAFQEKILKDIKSFGVKLSDIT